MGNSTHLFNCLTVDSATVLLFEDLEVVRVAVPAQRVAAVRVAIRSLVDRNLRTPIVAAAGTILKGDGHGVLRLVAGHLADEQARLTTEQELVALHDVLHGDAAAALDLHIRAINGHRSHSTNLFLGGSPP